MHLVLDYATLGNTGSRRRSALSLLVSLVNHPLGKVWTPAAGWAASDLEELLVQTGVADGVDWRENVPFVAKSWDGYVLTNSGLLVEDLMQFEEAPKALEFVHPTEYSAQVTATVLAGFRLWQDTVTLEGVETNGRDIA